MIRLIVAVDSRAGIAKSGIQPWFIPDDEAYFSRQTKSHGGNVLMGKTTYTTIGGPLNGRQNYVLSRNSKSLPGVTVVDDLGACVKQYKQQDLWVIGGASVYSQVIDCADEVYVTRIDADFNCDQFFPDITTKFELVSSGPQKNQNGFSYRYEIYKKAN